MKDIKELEELLASIKDPNWEHENPQLNEDEHIMSIQKDPEDGDQVIFIIANDHTLGIDSSIIRVGSVETGYYSDRLPVHIFLANRCQSKVFADWWYKMIEDYAVCFLYPTKIRAYKQN